MEEKMLNFPLLEKWLSSTFYIRQLSQLNFSSYTINWNWSFFSEQENIYTIYLDPV